MRATTPHTRHSSRLILLQVFCCALHVSHSPKTSCPTSRRRSRCCPPPHPIAHRLMRFAVAGRPRARQNPAVSRWRSIVRRRRRPPSPCPLFYCNISSGSPDSAAPLPLDAYVHGWCCLLQVTARRRPAAFRLNAAAGVQMVAAAADAELKMGRYHHCHRPACRARWRAYRSCSLLQSSCYRHAQHLVSRLSAKVDPAAQPHTSTPCAHSPLLPASGAGAGAGAGAGCAQHAAGVSHPVPPAGEYPASRHH